LVSGVIRRHRKSIGSCWRKLNSGQQALVVLAYLRKGETFAELAAGFGVGTTTAWRYVTETVELLAARAPRLRTAIRDAVRSRYAYVGRAGRAGSRRGNPRIAGTPGIRRLKKLH
jgi:Helix-turn-helix of DDE superfamily endonuclease